jgi:hypothetical protein
MAAAQAFSRLMVSKDPLENRIDVLEVVIEVEQRLQLGGAQQSCDFGIRF